MYSALNMWKGCVGAESRDLWWCESMSQVTSSCSMPWTGLRMKRTKHHQKISSSRIAQTRFYTSSLMKIGCKREAVLASLEIFLSKSTRSCLSLMLSSTSTSRKTVSWSLEGTYQTLVTTVNSVTTCWWPRSWWNWITWDPMCQRRKIKAFQDQWVGLVALPTHRGIQNLQQVIQRFQELLRTVMRFKSGHLMTNLVSLRQICKWVEKKAPRIWIKWQHKEWINQRTLTRICLINNPLIL